jgi:hypothetical protein
MKWWYRKNGLSSKMESIRHTYTIYDRKSAWKKIGWSVR